MHHNSHLKIKLMTLGAESRINRREQLRHLKDARYFRLVQKLEKANRSAATWESLYKHRKNVVRPAARAANIAYGFMRGLPYELIEKSFFLHRFGLDGISDISAYRDLWNDVIKNVSNFKDVPREVAREEVLKWRNSHPQIKPGSVLAAS